MKALVKLGATFDRHAEPDWQQNLMWAANQALCGVIGVGVPQDWATHRIAVELTALWGIDHGRTLAIIQPALLRELIEYKREKLEQFGREVFGLNAPSAEDAIAALETFYRSVNMPLHLRDAGISEVDAADRVLAGLRAHGKMALGGHAGIDEAKTERIVRAACA
ncbi:Alcohol dehydrogenase YqhD [bioreactor metagenome]|uniref:Alcohol dehydrogenase YqhD n=1 Tax=bioreactor metagenome TaxID=1076179 RepID=A0A645EN70_9ZZZZ